MDHDDRCEACWNDGICACRERAENAAHGFYRPSDHPILKALYQRVFKH